jgi:DNA-binding NarL/FixJ family response regulator
MLRAGLEALLRSSSEMQLVFIVDSLDEAQGRVDVVVSLGADLDSVPTSDFAPLVLISPQASPEFVRSALRAGARSVLPQDCTSVELHAAIEAAAAGLTTLRPVDAEALIVARSTIAVVPTHVSLSARETEVLRLLADGLSNKEIAFRLGISEHTIKFHVNSILTRLDASSRAEAVAIGVRQGLILL